VDDDADPVRWSMDKSARPAFSPSAQSFEAPAGALVATAAVAAGGWEEAADDDDDEEEPSPAAFTSFTSVRTRFAPSVASSGGNQMAYVPICGFVLSLTM
jgi:hypothetical protein